MVVVETDIPVVLKVQEEEAALTDVVVERSIDHHRHRSAVLLPSHEHRKELAGCLPEDRAEILHVDMGHNLDSGLSTVP